MESNYKIALNQALDWITSNYMATGIVVSGSIIRGNPDKHSDFDIYVIHDRPFRQRVQKFFNGVPCEIFVNNIEQIYKYFESELASNRPVSANILATGELLKGADNKQIIALITDAINYASMSRPLTDEQMLFRKYGIANLFEDATDTLLADRPTSMYILDKVVADIIEFIFSSKQQPLPRLKERLATLSELEPAVGLLIEKYYDTITFEQKYELTKEIVLSVTGQTEFFEWSSTPE